MSAACSSYLLLTCLIRKSILYRALSRVVKSPSKDFIISLKGPKIVIVSRTVSHLLRLRLFFYIESQFLLIKTQIAVLSLIANSSIVSHEFHLISLLQESVFLASARKV
jgi:hypothetical protein